MFLNNNQTDLERVVNNFRGDEGGTPIEKSNTFARILADIFDLFVYSKIDTNSENTVNKKKQYLHNQNFWNDILLKSNYESQLIELVDFHILEWLPYSPGLYYTKKASLARNRAEEYFSWTDNEYLPIGKEEMVLGGVGSVRLASKRINGEDYYFLCASSTGISHQGIPLLVPKHLYQKLIEAIKNDNDCIANIIGIIKILPLEKSLIEYDREIPKYCLLVETIKLNSSITFNPNDLLVTVAVVFPRVYKYERQVQIQTNKGQATTFQKSWTFASFIPDKQDEKLQETVYWLEKYVLRYSENHKMPILSNFDEFYNHFPSEFDICDIFSQQTDNNLLQKYCNFYHITYNTMEFNNGIFTGSTFNEYKGNVVQFLNNNNQFDEIDKQMFIAIEQYAKTEDEKKELVQAVVEVKSEKTEEQKTTFKTRIVNFLKENKEIFSTVLKIGISSVIGHYGLQGAEKLLGLD